MILILDIEGLGAKRLGDAGVVLLLWQLPGYLNVLSGCCGDQNLRIERLGAERLGDARVALFLWVLPVVGLLCVAVAAA